MDLGITIIGTVCVAVCAMPFVITNRSRNKKGKELLTSLKSIAEQHQGKITEHEICGNYAIGVDEEKSAVAFVSNKEGVLEPQFVDLSTIKSCEIEKITRLNSNKGEVINRLNLKLSPIAKNEPNFVLEFYNSEINYQFSGELQSIEKWNTLINNLLKSKI